MQFKWLSCRRQNDLKTFCQKIYRKSGRLHDSKSMGGDPNCSEPARVTEGQRFVRCVLTSLVVVVVVLTVQKVDRSSDRQTRSQHGSRKASVAGCGARGKRCWTCQTHSKYDFWDRTRVRQLSNKWRQREEAKGSELGRAARLGNDSALRLWNNDRRGSSVHNVTRIHDPKHLFIDNSFYLVRYLRHSWA